MLTSDKFQSQQNETKKILKKYYENDIGYTVTDEEEQYFKNLQRKFEYRKNPTVLGLMWQNLMNIIQSNLGNLRKSVKFLSYIIDAESDVSSDLMSGLEKETTPFFEDIPSLNFNGKINIGDGKQILLGREIVEKKFPLEVISDSLKTDEEGQDDEENDGS